MNPPFEGVRVDGSFDLDMELKQLNLENLLDTLGEIFATEGRQAYLGEDVTMAEHMLQAAALAQEEDACDELVAAALLHDIGHFAQVQVAAADWHREHDRAGYAILASHFSEMVAEPIRLHVAAKRYLCATDLNYGASLSPASIHTLELQGGPMSESECAEFRQDPCVEYAIRLRVWDDRGKIAGKDVPAFEHYLPVLRRVQRGNEN